MAGSLSLRGVPCSRRTAEQRLPRALESQVLSEHARGLGRPPSATDERQRRRKDRLGRVRAIHAEDADGNFRIEDARGVQVL